MDHQTAIKLAESFIKEQKAKNILNLKSIRKKLISNPNIIQLFKDVKDIHNREKCEQILFLNPLTHLFSEEYRSGEHLGIYKDCYTNLQILGTMANCRNLNLHCGRPGVIISGKDIVHEIPFSEYNLPNYFEDELVLSAFITELQSFIPNYNAVALEAYTDSDYGITRRELRELSPSNQGQFSSFLEEYLFDYYIIDKESYYPKESAYMAKHCVKVFDYGILTPLGGIGFKGTHGTIGVGLAKKSSTRTYGQSGDGWIGEFPYFFDGKFTSPHFYERSHYKIVGVYLESVSEVAIDSAPSLKWY